MSAARDAAAVIVGQDAANEMVDGRPRRMIGPKPPIMGEDDPRH